MKTLLFVMALTLFSASSFASELSPESVDFAKVTRLYNSGVALQLDSLSEAGWKTGRCFMAKSPSYPLNGALIKTESSSSVGPLSTIPLIFQVSQRRENADYFDKSSPTVKESISLTVDSFKYLVTVPTEVGNSTQVTVYDRWGSPVTTQSFRHSSGYIVSTEKCLIRSGCTSLQDGKVYETNSVMAACYFFNDVL